ncbi:class I SAM-dependent methyltransferase [Streptomyces violascens]|uniref:class I SAM-dependent methyltransferase n=1 Tax=Streptomyces violascens TaxID=67381 RepID=UPI001671F6AA|nr:class I SAM-dependent methyltransferase [Streptomyces violascens]GGU37754.1 methyltransferase [Streptomyces violascens]
MDETGRQQQLWDQWAPHYNHEHQGRDPGPAVDFLASLTGTAGKALELAVGTGRIALPLADLGIPVTGIDVSAAMLDELHRHRGDRAVTTHTADMADLDTGSERFELIYVAFSSFYFLMTQPRQAACLQQVVRALAPGGRFVIEATIPRAPGLLAGAQQLAIRDLTDTHLSLSAITHDPIAQTIRFQELRFDQDGLRLLPVAMRYVHLSELDLLAADAGLNLTDRYADWHRAPLTATSTQHISVYTPAGAAP